MDGRRRTRDQGQRTRDGFSIVRRQAAIDHLRDEYPSLSAFVENRIVLGRSPRDISQEIGVRFGLRVSSAAVAAHRHRMNCTGAKAVEQTFQESRREIDRLIDLMGTEGSEFVRTISATWRKLRRRLGGKSGE